MIVQVLVNKGVLNNHHEIGRVLQQKSENMLLVAPIQFDKDPEEIPCASIEGGYRPGDTVLIEYINNSAHHKFVMCVMQKGYEQADIDYTQLRDTPFRVYRTSNYLDPGCGYYHDIHRDIEPLVSRVVYDEGSPMEWTEVYNRRGNGEVFSVTTYWPPNNTIRFTNYIVRDENDYFHYYGPNARAAILNPKI